MSKNILIISPTMIKARTQVHDATDEKFMFPEIKACQDLYIHPILGTDLFNKILNDIEAGTLAGVYKTLVDDYLIDCLLNYVLAELPEGMNYQISAKGLMQKTSEGANNVSMDDMYKAMSKYKNRAEHYAERAVLYLKKNKADFTEYLNPGTDIDDIKPDDDSFTNPFYLGE